MPRSIRKRGRKRRRTYYNNSRRKKVRRLGSWAHMNRLTIRAPSFLPDRLKTHHDFVYQFVEAGPTSGRDFTIQGNNLFRPMLGVNQSPVGYNQLATVYDRTQVHGCAVKIKFNSTTTNLGQIGIYPTMDGTIPSTLTVAEIEALPRSKSRMFNNNSQVQMMNVYFKTSAIIGRSLMQSTNFSANVNQSPGTQYYIHVRQIYTNPLTASDNHQFRIQVRMYVEWFHNVLIEQNPV